MKEIRVPRESFDAEALLARTIHFLSTQVSPEVDPTCAIVRVEDSEHLPVFGLKAGWDVLSALYQEGKIVFFPFAFTDANGTLTCADGNTYRPAPDDEESEEEMLIGMEDSVGFLVQIKDGSVIINSAICAGGGCPGPAPSVNLHPDCGLLEQPMERFIRGFIKG